MSVTVNEVDIVFHATDTHHLPVLDLRPDEVKVFDNEEGPGKVVSLQRLQNQPIRVAFLIDTSASVAATVARTRAEAGEAARQLLSRPPDEGLIVTFARFRRVIRPWTHDESDLGTSFKQVLAASNGAQNGTSLYDALYSTCLYEFGKNQQADTENVVLLFSDGEDLTSSTTLRNAIDVCRQSHTVIYAFAPEPAQGTSPDGAASLRALAGQTGGRLFDEDASDSKIKASIDALMTDLRSAYLLIYRPGRLRRNGAFHRIALVAPSRVVDIEGTSGFYAPTR